MLQDWDPRGYGVPVATLVNLFATVEAVRAVKVEVVPAGRKYSELLTATDRRLYVSGGWVVMQMFEALDRGVHAFMPTARHAINVRIYQLHMAGQGRRHATCLIRCYPCSPFPTSTWIFRFISSSACCSRKAR